MNLSKRAAWIAAAPLLAIAVLAVALPFAWRSAGFVADCARGSECALRDLVADGEKVRETLARAAVYKAAGADGLFVPGLTETADIAQITGGTDLPVNLMASPELPKATELARLNVRRLSAGAGISKIAWHHIARVTTRFLAEGDSGVLAEDALTFAQLQDVFQPRA